jgi:hypothetical protein
MKFKKIFYRILLSLTLITTLYSGVPQKTYAIYGVADVVVDPTNLVQNTTSAIANPITAAMTTLEKVKFYVLDPLAWSIAKRILQGVTAQTVNWINSGFQGNPAYITDPGRFFLNIADEKASEFLSGTELNQLCTPFRARVRLALVQNYIQENRQNYSCSLSLIRNNYEQFVNDFRYGGWDSWLEITQNPANNPYGAYFAAQNEINQRIATAQKNVERELDQGHGFLSYKRCPEGMENPSPANGFGDCLTDEETVTPGSVIESQLEKALGSGVDQLNLADSFNEIVSALVTNLFKRVVGGSGNGGLYGSSNYVTVPEIPPPGVPYIRVLGDNPYHLELDANWRDPGAVAVDDVDGDISDNIVVTDNINRSVAGQYTVTYTVTNSAGVTATATRTVQVGNYVTPGGGSGGGGGGGTGGGNTGTGTGPWNITGALDIGSVNIVGPAPDVRSWPETTQITSGSWNGNWSIDFTQRNSWATCETPGVFGPVSYTIWAFVQVNGQWYGSAFERDYPGDTNSGGPGDPKLQLPQNWWYDQRWTNMFGHRPVTGEQVGFMVTNGNHRLTDAPCTASQSRSNIVLVTMP